MPKQAGLIAVKSAQDWFTVSLKYRTSERLAEHIQAAIDEAFESVEEYAKEG